MSSCSLDAFRVARDEAAAFTDVLKEFSAVPGGMTARGTQGNIDGVIRKRVYKIIDSAGGLSRTGITIPSTTAATQTTVRARGRFAYVEFRPVPTAESHLARKQPIRHLSFSIDVANKRSYVYRLIFSTEFERLGELRLGQIAHLPLPM
jgi:hypothetical protein